MLYVGVTGNVHVRLSGHRSSQPWWDEVAAVETTPYDDRATALAVELLAIEQERPVYNVIHSGRSWKYRRVQRAKTAGISAPNSSDDLLVSVASTTAEWNQARERLVVAVQAAFDAGINRSSIAESARLTRDGLYKLLKRTASRSNA